MGVKVERIQWPVGQGNFSTGHVEIDKKRFDYVYDCGSTNISALRSCISAFRQKRSIIDALFISHLDSDHVNGIDLLTTSRGFQVSTVYLPFISDVETIYLLSAELEKGALTTGFTEFLSDPAKWFGDRGVKRLVFVQRPEEPDDREPDDNGPDEPRSEGNQVFGFGDDSLDQNDTRLGIRYSERLIKNKSIDTVGCVTHEISPRCDIGLGVTSHIEWVLAPFVPPISDKKFSEFSKSIRGIGVFDQEGKIDRKKLLDHIKDDEKRRRLKQAYRKLASDHNRISMCLYSGSPFKQDVINHHVRHVTHRGYRFLRPAGKAGWVGTGDSMFQINKVRRAFKKKYHHYLQDIVTLMCPHHGAFRSFHHDLLQVMDPELCFASHSLSNSYGHPHQRVIDQVVLHGSEFLSVNEKAESKLTELIECI